MAGKEISITFGHMSSVKSILKRKIRKFVSSFYDPLIDVTIGSQRIKTPLSHSLKENIAVHPELNFNLGRIVKYVADKKSNTTVIDIGANVGDTVAYIKNFADVPILCIDGDKKYLDVLKQNVTQYKNIEICHTLVGAENTEISASLKVERGTAFLTESKEKNQVRTIENILEEYPAFKNGGVLKIDTDGYDALILKGSANYLKRSKPVIFFEFDPYLTVVNNEDPFALLPYLQTCGYRYFMFYMSNGDFLTGCDIEQDRTIIDQLIHYYSGRNVTLYTDVCAFTADDKAVFDYSVTQELQHYRAARHY
jgi:FkbM family methyltransferase